MKDKTGILEALQNIDSGVLSPQGFKAVWDAVRPLVDDLEREGVAMDVTVQNVEILRGRLEQVELALAGMLFAFDDGVGQEWSAPVLDFARQLVKAKEFDASQQGEQCISDTGSCGVGGYCAECPSKHPEQAEGAQGERESGCCCPPIGFSGAWAAGPCPVHMGLSRAALAQPSPAPELERPEGER